MNSLLGETERRFTQSFATLEAMSPNVVFIDELEKVFGDSSERDGGTMMRCTGSVLSWLSDNPYPPDSIQPLSQAGTVLKDIVAIIGKMKALEDNLVQLSKGEKNLLSKERKEA